MKYSIALFCRKYPNTPPTLYPTVLAVLDTFICALYILIFGADAAVFYLEERVRTR